MSKTKIFPVIFILLTMAAILMNPSVYIKAANDGMMIFALNIIPTLFPFIFLSKMLSELSLEGYTPKFAGKIYARTLKVPPRTLDIFFLSLISGYPIGSKLISERNFDLATSKKLCGFCSNPGILFVIGTIGASMLFNVACGIIIYASCILSSLLFGVVYGRIAKKETPGKVYTPNASHNDNLLYASMTNSILSIFIIGGYIILFSVLSAIFLNNNLFYPITFLFSKIGIPTFVMEGVLVGLMEFTNGCLLLSRMNLSLSTVTVLCSFLTAFGGLCIAAQSVTYLKNSKIKISFYLFIKVIHSALSIAISFLLCLIFL